MERIEILRYFVWTTEFISFVVGVFYIKKLKTPWQAFPFYLGITFFIEMIGRYLIQEKMYQETANLHKYFATPFQFIFIFGLYSTILNLKKSKLFFISACIIYLISWVFENFFISKQGLALLSISYSIANLLILIFVLIYFYRLIFSDDILQFRSLQAFWVSLGILIYYLGSFPFFGLFNLLYTNYRKIHITYFQIMLILDCIMYLFFTASFIWGRKEK